MGAKNKVIAGDYKGKQVASMFGEAMIMLSWRETISLAKHTVANYEIVDSAHTKSATSAVGRGLIGASLLGPVGLLAGLSAKNKGVHVVALEFTDGKKSLLEVDDKIYKAIMAKCF